MVVRINEALRNEVFDRDKDKCVKCGNSYPITVNHILSIKDGGKTTFDNLQTVCFSHSTESIEVIRKFISPEWEAQIKDRDNNRCVGIINGKTCGNTTRLEVDHVTPFSEGGRTVDENLQTLCKRCNINKREDSKDDKPVYKVKMGRPRIYKTVEELQEQVDAYFDDTPDEQLTLSGLALYLGVSRDVVWDYGKSELNPDLSDTIKKAKMRIENSIERSLRKSGKVGDIFMLKNYGWSDKQQVTVSDPEGKALPPPTFVFNMPDGSKLNAQQVAAQQASKPE